jgi:hypothetical protein
MEAKLIKGAIFKTLVMEFEEHTKIKQKYFKILSVRKKPTISIFGRELQGFNVKEMKYELDHTELMAVDEDTKKVKLVDFYKLKETKEKPRYFKYKYMDWKGNFIEGCNEILKDDQLCYTVDRYD